MPRRVEPTRLADQPSPRRRTRPAAGAELGRCRSRSPACPASASALAQDAPAAVCASELARCRQQREALAAWRTAAAICQGWRAVLRQSREQGDRCRLRHSLQRWCAARVSKECATAHARSPVATRSHRDVSKRRHSRAGDRSSSRARRRRSRSAMCRVRWRSGSTGVTHRESHLRAGVLQRATLLLQQVLTRCRSSTLRCCAWRQALAARVSTLLLKARHTPKGSSRNCPKRHNVYAGSSGPHFTRGVRSLEQGRRAVQASAKITRYGATARDLAAVHRCGHVAGMAAAQ